jgi:DNA-binding protein H-NS
MVMIMSRTVNITPHKSLFEKIGSVGFSTEEAIAEFVDNSLDAKYNPKTGEPIIPEKIGVKLTLKPNRIIVEDNSAGIFDFDSCLKLAFSEKQFETALGQFGLGLKTASMSLGRKLTVESKRIGEKQGHRATLDLDTWYQDEEWRIGVEDFESDGASHWTCITLEKLYVDPTVYVNDLRAALSVRFGEFVLNEELSIKINGLEVVPEQRVFLDPSKDAQFERAVQDLGLEGFETHKEFSFNVSGMIIRGWVDFLKERSLTGRFGFNVYRSRRLIVPYVKIGIRDHPSNANIFGHIYLPRGFPISFTKNKIEVQRNVYEELKQHIEALTLEYRRISAKMAQQTVPVISPKTLSSMEKSISILEKAIPKSQVIKDLLPEPFQERARALQKDAEEFGEVDAEKRKPKINPTAVRPIPKEARVRNPRHRRQKKNYWYITLPTGKIKLIHEFAEVEGSPPKMYFSEFYEDRSPPEFVVTTNVKFDAWGTTKDEAFYATGVIINALSKLIEGMAERKVATAFDVQEDIWRLWGKEFHTLLSVEAV